MIKIPDTGEKEFRVIATAMPDNASEVLEFWSKLVVDHCATLIVNMYGNSEIIDADVPYFPASEQA